MEEHATTRDAKELALTQFHPSAYESNRYAYPVVSRRSHGVSIGVNLSPTKLCNFRCVYCQIRREEKDEPICGRDALRLDLNLLEQEAESLARATISQQLFTHERFAKTPIENRVLRDFAFSGDGEPTLAPQFHEVVEILARVRERLNYDAVKLILITNATTLQNPAIVAALDDFHVANGQIWAKLDAHDQARLQMVNRTSVPYERILDNILFASQRWSVTIQTALFQWRGQEPDPEMLHAYSQRLNDVVRQGGRINGVQLYTVARVPTCHEAVALTNQRLDQCAELVKSLTDLPVEVFYNK